jgi:anti-sigma factor RsiW
MPRLQHPPCRRNVALFQAMRDATQARSRDPLVATVAQADSIQSVIASAIRSSRASVYCDVTP